MNDILHSPVSVLHLVAALMALLTGTYGLTHQKGTSAHRWAGWIYVGSMVVLLSTAFRIYFLFGRFGVIHWGAVGSIAALAAGIIPLLLRTVWPGWLRWHYVGMSASVTGLYAAFLVESTYRFFPPLYFWWVTMGSANVVFVIGAVLSYRNWPFSPTKKAVRHTATGALMAGYES